MSAIDKGLPAGENTIIFSFLVAPVCLVGLDFIVHDAQSIVWPPHRPSCVAKAHACTPTMLWAIVASVTRVGQRTM